MKKLITIALISLLYQVAKCDQIPAITFTTTKPVGSYVEFSIQVFPFNTTIQVDYGDGNLVSQNIAAFDIFYHKIVATQNIKIYGSNIISFHSRYNNISEIDLTNCTTLDSLDVSNNQLESLDLSKNTMLSFLNCQNNLLSTLDLSHNQLLRVIYCFNNLLSTIDVSNNTLVDSINLQQNNFNLATLPILGTSVSYYYAPQKTIIIPKNLTTDDKIDFNSQQSISGNETSFTWKTKSGTILISGTDYELTNGITTFLKPQEDSIYCSLENATFPKFNSENVLNTTLAKISSVTLTEERRNQKFIIYSVLDNLLITSPINNVQISVFNINGIPIKSAIISKGLNNIYISKSGLLLIILKWDNKIISQKLFIPY